jgi:tartrate-resistant acid phosphatase type 5
MKYSKFGQLHTRFKPRCVAVCLTMFFLQACGASDVAKVSTPIADESPLSVGFIAFGDSGYHADYIEEEDYLPPVRTLEEFNELARQDWLEDHRAAADFTPPVPHFLEQHGGYIEASGLTPVATAMKKHCLSVECEFSVMLGDNIYPDGATMGTDGFDDEERFRKLFEVPFGDMGAGNDDYRIYVAMGNHDWNTSREGAMAQIEYMEKNAPFYVDSNIYRVKPPAGRGEIELFIIDTAVLLASTTVMEDSLNPDGSEGVSKEVEDFESWVKPATELELNMMHWLEKGLRESTAQWKFVIAHHPIWSTGGSKYEQARALRPLLMPAMCRYADAYFAGHEHALELHEDSCAKYSETSEVTPLTEIISGAAAKQRGVNTGFMRYQTENYPENNTIWAKGMAWGFAHLQLEGDTATVSMFTTPNDGSGEVVPEMQHQFQRRSGSSAK